MCRVTPEKSWGIGYYILFHIRIYIYAHTHTHAASYYGNAIGCYGDARACARNVYQVLPPPLTEGPGYKARQFVVFKLKTSEKLLLE